MLVNDIPTLWREVHPGSNAPLLAEALTTVQGMFGRKNMQRYFHQLQVLRDVRAVKEACSEEQLAILAEMSGKEGGSTFKTAMPRTNDMRTTFSNGT